MSECLPHALVTKCALVTRAGEGVGEGRVEEGGRVRGWHTMDGFFSYLYGVVSSMMDVVQVINFF